MKLLLALGVLSLSSCVFVLGPDGVSLWHGEDHMEVNGVELREKHTEILEVAGWAPSGLRVESNLGDVAVLRGEGKDTLEVTLHEATPDDAWAEHVDGRIVVRTVSGQPAALGDVTVRVATPLPHLYAGTGLGDIRIAEVSVTGEITATTGLGDVRVTSPGRATRLALSTGLGDVEVSGATCDTISASTGLGGIDLRTVEAQEASLSAGAGDVDVRGSAFGRLEATTDLGDVDCWDVRYDSAHLDSGLGSVRRR